MFDNIGDTDKSILKQDEELPQKGGLLKKGELILKRGRGFRGFLTMGLLNYMFSVCTYLIRCFL